MASVRLLRLKLLLACAFYCYLNDQHYETTTPNNKISHFAQALLYYQLQAPSPLLSRINRQHNSTTSPLVFDANSNGPGSDDYQAQSSLAQSRKQQEQQTSYLSPVKGALSENFLEDIYGCPFDCHCNRVAQIADCSNRNLTRVPSSFPKDIKRIRLERNNITEIGPYSFQGLKRLQRIDLSNNKLQRIDQLAFSGGLHSLNSLILYSNKLENLPANVFGELSQLQLLLLNANSLQSISKDLFQSLANLNLLSLYDNNIESLATGTFDGLKSIKTM